MSTIHLTNINIRRLFDKNGNPYYLIVDKDSDQAYFVFEWKLKVENDWFDLNEQWEKLTQLEFEYQTNDQGNKQVIDIFTFRSNDTFII